MSETNVPLSPEFAKRRLQELGATVLFEKVLTTSDTSGSGRIVIPKSIAEANFPPIDTQNGVVVHVLDVFGRKYSFRYRFWINNASRMYIVEGTQELQARFKMAVGDVLVFARTDSSQIYCCGRKSTKEDLVKKAPAGKRKGNGQQQGVPREKKRPATAAGTSGANSGDAWPASVSPEPQKAEERRGKAGSKRTQQRAQDVAAAGTEAAAAAAAAAEEGASLTYSYWNASSHPARRDGVFRSVPASAGLEGVGNVVKPQHGLWTAVVSLGGEAFQAFFDSREAAVAACEAAQQTAGG